MQTTPLESERIPPAATFRPVKHELLSKVGGKVARTVGASAAPTPVEIVVDELAASTPCRAGQCKSVCTAKAAVPASPLKEETSQPRIGGNMVWTCANAASSPDGAAGSEEWQKAGGAASRGCEGV